MATLLMVESWLHSTGLRLPPLLGELGHRYVLLTREPALYPPDGAGGAHPVVRDADEIVCADTNDPAAVVEAATNVAARRRVDGIVTTCDYYLEAVAHAAHALRLPGPEPEAVRRSLCKHEVRTATQRAAVPTPAYGVADSWEQAQDVAARIGYPVVAKPVDLNSGTSVRLVADDADLKDAVAEITAVRRNSRGQPLARLVLVEELLDGPEVSVEAVTQDGVTTVLGITAKQVTGDSVFVEAGHAFPAALEPAAARSVVEHVRAALAALGHTHGLSHTEVRLTPAGPRIVEVNPRQGGGYIFDLVRLVTGTNPLEVLVNLALGQSLDFGRVSAPGGAAAPAAAVRFVNAARPGTLTAVDGLDALMADPAVVRCEVNVPHDVGPLRDNNARLGHVLTVGADPAQALARATAAVDSLRLRFAHGRRGSTRSPEVHPA